MKVIGMPIQPTPVHDYGDALQSAKSWLGSRHLLAEPVPRRKEVPKADHVEPHRWYVVPGKRQWPLGSGIH